MDNCERFNETPLAEEKTFTVTSIWKILMVQITPTGKRFVKIYELLLADVFENFLNMRLEIYELDPVKVL